MADSDNDFLQELEALFKEEPQSQEEEENASPEEKEGTETKEGESQPDNDTGNKTKETTANVSKRINEVREKTERETLDRVAKEAGFENYAAMQKSNQEKLLKDRLQSVDPDADATKLSPVIEEMVKKQVEEHPDVKAIREEKLRIFAKEQLEELNKLTGEKFSLNTIPADVKEHWSKSGNLKASYLALYGESLITKVRAGLAKGITSHLETPSGNSVGNQKNLTGRPLTAEEKTYYKKVNPSITDEALNNKRI